MTSSKKTNEIRISVFKVEEKYSGPDLHQTLSTIGSIPSLAERNREVGNLTARIEEVREPNKDTPYWLMDFIRLRSSHGPGKAHPDRPIEGFAMGDGNVFGEETAMLFCPKSKVLLAQYNHFGVKDGSAAKYFAQFTQGQNEFKLLPFLANDVAAKLAKADSFSRLTFRVAVNKVNPEYRENDVALKRMLEAADETGSPYLDVTLGVGNTRGSLKTDSVKKLADTLTGLISEDSSAVTRAQIHGRNTEEEFSISEVLDLITPTVRYYEEAQLNPSELRLTLESRFDALRKAYAAWNSDKRSVKIQR